MSKENYTLNIKNLNTEMGKNAGNKIHKRKHYETASNKRTSQQNESRNVRGHKREDEEKGVKAGARARARVTKQRSQFYFNVEKQIMENLAKLI